MLSGSFNALSLLACDPSFHEKVFDIFLYMHTYIHTYCTYSTYIYFEIYVEITRVSIVKLSTWQLSKVISPL